jgi:hypothetical protein
VRRCSSAAAAFAIEAIALTRIVPISAAVSFSDASFCGEPATTLGQSRRTRPSSDRRIDSAACCLAWAVTTSA